MRIACLNLHWPRYYYSGVGKKIINQIKLWKDMGNEVEFFMHMHEPEKYDDLLKGQYFIFNNPKSKFDVLASEFSRSCAFGKLIKSVEEYKPDIIYYRNSMYVFPMHTIFKNNNIVIEIASHDVFEHNLLGFPYSTYNKLTRGIALSRAKGLVFLSNELSISKFYKKYNRKSLVIGDGILLDSLPNLDAPCNQIPKIYFIGSHGKVWHGVDKLLGLAIKFPDLDINVIGYDNYSFKGQTPNNLHFLGYLREEKLIDALSNADIAISSMALHRININEMSPLKTRETVGMGIPTILPYIDTDLANKDIFGLLHISNCETNILDNGKLIHDFAYEMIGKRIQRNTVQNLIDARLKEKDRLDFFEKEILSNNR